MRMLHEDYKAQVHTRPRSSFFACTLRKFQASKGLRILITAMRFLMLAGHDYIEYGVHNEVSADFWIMIIYDNILFYDFAKY